MASNENDVRGKILNGIKSMYVNSQTFIRVKGSESECFRIEWLFNIYMDAVMKEVKGGREKVEIASLLAGR